MDKTIPIIRAKVISRSDLQNNPHALYVFGDNFLEQGRGGQAFAMRGEPNAVGLPTKRTPSMDFNAFFEDSDLDKVKAIARPRLHMLLEHLKKGGVVVLPSDGIGTGLARLKENAPTIFSYYEKVFDYLINKV